jgi:hypothetical protein
MKKVIYEIDCIIDSLESKRFELNEDDKIKNN